MVLIYEKLACEFSSLNFIFVLTFNSQSFFCVFQMLSMLSVLQGLLLL